MGLTRREFVLGASTLAATAGCRTSGDDVPLVRFGLITDLHYAKIPNGEVSRGVSRHYSQSVRKLVECVDVMNERGVDFLVELGDLKDLSATKAETLSCLDEIESVFARFRGARYHVIGNHDNDCLTKEEFLAHIGNSGQTKPELVYSFESGGVTFVVLDANFNARMEPYAPGNWDWKDSNVPPEELAWLERTLGAADGPVVILAHQRLDFASGAHHRVRNAADVRAILERSGKVVAVFTGHDHSGGHSTERGIFYYTLKAAVLGTDERELNSYAEVSISRDGKIAVTGFGEAESKVTQ